MLGRLYRVSDLPLTKNKVVSGQFVILLFFFRNSFLIHTTRGITLFFWETVFSTKLPAKSRVLTTFLNGIGCGNKIINNNACYTRRVLLSFRDRKPVHDKRIAREDRKAISVIFWR